MMEIVEKKVRSREKKVRKTITLSPEAIRSLEVLAEAYKEPHSVLIEKLIQKGIEELRLRKRKEAIEWIKTNRASFKGTAGSKSFQELKAEMGSEL